ncbi:hypothetical protein BDY24DRAFT_52491 [Mrakia frigida]|uniref:uncharacterized protein n=1 Tax=Mrakia frigida TaxID=29902 RepID=UPI003FCC10B5
MSSSTTTTSFKNVRLLSSIPSSSSLYDVLCSPSGITSILPASSGVLLDKEDHLPELWDRTTLSVEGEINEIDGMGSWLMPGLNHPHLHLDKSYLLGSGPSVPGSSYSCGIIETGDFNEAMQKTLQAKSSFTPTSLLSRSSSLLSFSLSAGVTSLTTHVEVDPSLSPPALSLLSALELKQTWKGRINIRIVVFAQEACFVEGEVGEERRRVVEQACGMEGVDAVGSAPYVEKAEEGDDDEEGGDPTGGRGAKNVEWVFELAERWGLDVDFHLDYDLSPDRHPLIWTVLAEARSQPAFHLPSLSSSSLPTTSSNPSQPSPKHRTLTLGHMTHLSLFTPAQLSLLETKTRGLDVTFVALPTSDLYMMGRDASSWRERGRGSFDIWELEGRGMKVLMGLKWVVSSFFFRFVESD